jgi:hypothetical protein
MNRYISLSRKNSLFFGSHKRAERGAILYTIALTCRMNIRGEKRCVSKFGRSENI